MDVEGRGGHRATLAAVARHAGVSLATASKVLNGRDGVGEATRRRVREAMSALGYRPTTARADDPTAGVRRINALLPDLDTTMYSPQMLNALLVAAPAFRMEIVPRLTGVVGVTDDDEASWWTRKLLGGGGQGAIIITTEPSQALLTACATVSLPIVTIDCYGTIALDLPSVSSNNFAGGYSAAQHLLTLGHRRIGLIRGADNASFSRERAFGFLAALSEHDLTVPEGLLIEAGFDYEGGLRAGRTMLDRADRPTAIAANCDSVAIGVIEAARQLGLRVPQDVSVVGFDDTKLAMWSTPQLTTVNQPLGDIARVALRMMSRLLDGQEPDSPHVQLATKLVLRDSTARPTDGLAQ